MAASDYCAQPTCALRSCKGIPMRTSAVQVPTLQQWEVKLTPSAPDMCINNAITAVTAEEQGCPGYNTSSNLLDIGSLLPSNSLTKPTAKVYNQGMRGKDISPKGFLSQGLMVLSSHLVILIWITSPDSSRLRQPTLILAIAVARQPKN